MSSFRSSSKIHNFPKSAAWIWINFREFLDSLFERVGPLPWNRFVKIDFLGPVNPESKRIWMDNPSLIQQKSELIILKSDQMNQNPARNWHSNYGEWIQRLHDWYYFRLYCIHPISIWKFSKVHYLDFELPRGIEMWNFARWKYSPIKWFDSFNQALMFTAWYRTEISSCDLKMIFHDFQS